MSTKAQFYLLSLLLLGTIILTTRFFNFGMMGLTVFVLAYLSKGMRRYSLKNKLPNPKKTDHFEEQVFLD
ncbi:hypothetical protein PCC7424_0348 [Gloeothece citriformis PCC 7424]|uniref:Uncharacterized protein n=1 Tax=Gloeothece citriformis (strain PCC 7424) TaxID=65393 RepID=B7KBZ3_GLOC7|nr:hypothetical protein [Gloeothece citriformis]ACK68816.1 hypothetical protein PCC7424_0348 [Gloeothece citriformis PCC 7424]